LGREEEGDRDRELPGAAGRPDQRPGQEALRGTRGRLSRPRAAPGRVSVIALGLAATLAAAFLARAAALRYLEGRASIEIVGGAVRLGLVENAGAFLGLGSSLPEGARRGIFLVGVGAVLFAALVWLLRVRAITASRTAAAVLMIGGGLANFLDRLPDGRVTDYVVLSAGPLRTGVFNLADAAILTGAILWLGSGITRRRDAPSSDA
jgi:signal peptidase II